MYYCRPEERRGGRHPGCCSRGEGHDSRGPCPSLLGETGDRPRSDDDACQHEEPGSPDVEVLRLVTPAAHERDQIADDHRSADGEHQQSDSLVEAEKSLHARATVVPVHARIPNGRAGVKGSRTMPHGRFPIGSHRRPPRQ